MIRTLLNINDDWLLKMYCYLNCDTFRGFSNLSLLSSGQ